MIERSRIISKNASRNDGTPRLEKGYRAFVDMAYESNNEVPVGTPWWIGRKIYQSPLFKTREDAESWKPNAGTH